MDGGNDQYGRELQDGGHSQCDEHFPSLDNSFIAVREREKFLPTQMEQEVQGENGSHEEEHLELNTSDVGDRWADLCSDEENRISVEIQHHIGLEQGQQAVVVADAAPIAQVNSRDMEVVNRVIEDKMVEIANLLEITVEGRLEEL